MLRRMEQRNREVWSGHPTILEDFTHVIGGIGLGLMLYPVLKERRIKPLAWAMVLASAAIHCYADTFKPNATKRAQRRARRKGIAESLKSRFA